VGRTGQAGNAAKRPEVELATRPERLSMHVFIIALVCLLVLMTGPMLPRPEAAAGEGPRHGLEFACAVEGIERYMDGLGIDRKTVVRAADAHGVRYTLAGAADDDDTLHLSQRPELALREEIVLLPDGDEERAVATVSKKEILLALMQRGRLTRFAGSACNLRALEDHVGIRQNVAAWAERLNWRWPDGRSALWNGRYWRNGTPRRDVPLHRAVRDAFDSPDKYRIGCYAATKLIVMQGLLDYYARVRPDPARLRDIEARLWSDGEPLAAVEPAAMWSFEPGFDARGANRPGKIVGLQYGVASRNFVPGDWAYFLNTDPVSYGKTGYEGSNVIYLGRGRFSDAYNENHHAYTWREKLDEVYQWKNGVFSRSRHIARRKPLTEAELLRLRETPQNGGLLLDLRAVPYLSFPASG
jgi:hypothetical protein